MSPANMNPHTSAYHIQRLTVNGISIIVSLLINTSCLAQIPGLEPQKSWELNGYIDYRMSNYWIENASDSIEQSVQQRFNYEYRPLATLRFNASMRNRLVYGGTAEAPNYAQWFGRDSGYADLSHNWLEEDKLVANSQFDRAYLTWQDGDWQFQGGRFRINWGMTTIWNPNDIFNTYSVYETQYIERPGTDGVLLHRQLGFASSVELAFSPSKQRDEDRYAARYYFNFQEWDGQLIAGKSEYDKFIGLGFSGEISGAGVRGESSYFHPDNKTHSEGLSSTVISSFETDYSFASQRNWAVKFGILYTSNPQLPENSTSYFTQPLSSRTLSFTRFTGYTETGFDLTPLNRSTLSMIYYQDHSVYLNYTNQYSLSDNWQLSASIQHFDGSDNSLFGTSRTTIVYASVRWDW